MLTPAKRMELRLMTLALLLTLTLLGIGAYFIYQKSQELPPNPGSDRLKASATQP